MNNDLATINPKVLAWAIERRGLSIADLAKKARLKATFINAFLEGRIEPPFDLAMRLADVLRIPFGVLFLDVPPTIDTPLPDLRRLGNMPLEEPRVDFMDLLHQAMRQHDWYKKHQYEQGAEQVPFVGKFSLNSETLEVAKAIRELLRMGPELLAEVQTREAYLSALIARTELAGVLVMRKGQVGESANRPVSVDEYQGFAVADLIAPLICINPRDYAGAKIFTLIHELCHILLGVSGISITNQEVEVRPTLDVEVFCDRVAAEALIPLDQLKRSWTGRYDEIEMLANHFKVSVFVVNNRALDANLIDWNTWDAFRRTAITNIKQKKRQSGGNALINIEVRNSPTFLSALLTEVRYGTTTYREAARLLGRKVATIPKLLGGSPP